MSETKIKTKKKVNKMAIAVVTLSLALIAAIVGIFGVYAALQQNVSTTFSVSYSIGKNVAVAIGAKTGNTQTAASGFVWTWFEADTTLTKNSNNLYEIGINNNNQNLNLHLPSANNGVLNLSGNMESQLIVFYFQNLSSSAINVSIADNCTIVGDIEVSYTWGSFENVSNFPQGMDRLTSLNEPQTIPAGMIGELTVGICLSGRANLNQSSSYTSDSNGGLSFRFEQA